MILIAPTVGGPLSPCSTQIRVSGFVKGAIVTILVNGQAKHVSNPTNATAGNFPIGTTLKPGDEVRARQSFGTDISDPSPLATVVQQSPAQLGNLNVVTPLFACGRALAVEGALPGAEIDILIGGSQIATMTSVHGRASSSYAPPLSEGKTLELRQRSCNNLTKITVSPPAGPMPEQLPRPIVTPTVFECQTSISVQGLTPGATLSLWRDGTHLGEVAVAGTSFRWTGLQPFSTDEVFELRQSMKCADDAQVPDIESVARKFMPSSASSMPKPVILKPVCPDATFITITNMTPEARLLLFIDGVAGGYTDVPAVSFDFPAPRMKPDAVLTAQLQLCGKSSPLSDPVKLTEDQPIEKLEVATIYDCASHVSMFSPGIDQLNGKIVHVTDDEGNEISAKKVVKGRAHLAAIGPAAQLGRKLTIHVAGCGGKSTDFGPFEVQDLDHLPPPLVHEPVESGQLVVWADSEHAGARIDLFVKNLYATSRISRGEISLTKLLANLAFLEVGDQVHLTQSLCAMQSSKSPPASVVIPKPDAPVLIAPAHDAIVPVSGTVFEWSDPGAGQPKAAATFTLKVYDNGGDVVNDTIGVTSHMPAATLPHGATYFWKVVAANPPWTIPSVTRIIHTKPKPQDGGNGNGNGNGGQGLLFFTSQFFASLDQQTEVQFYPPAGAQFYVCIGVGNAGTAASDPAELLFEAWQSSTLLDQHIEQIASKPSGWSDIVCWQVGPFPAGDYYFFVQLYVGGKESYSTALGTKTV